MTTNKLNIAVLGAGSWGSALAILLSKNGHQVRLWSHRQAQADALRQDTQNSRYLPGITLPDMHITSDLADAMSGTDIVLLVVPSHVFRQTLTLIKPLLTDTQKLAWATKGFEQGSGKLLHQQVNNF